MSYRERVLRDLAEWQKSGWVTSDGAAAIAASLPKGRGSFGFAAIVGMLGAILVGAGLIAFVAANWEAIPRVVRFGGAIAVMAVAYLVAWPLRRREHPGFSEAALLVAGAAFAGLLALLGQTYNMGDEFTGLMAIWTAGVLAAALVLASPVMTLMGLIGGVVWSFSVTSATEGPHWLGVVPVLAGGAVAVLLASPVARFFSVVAFMAWSALALSAAAIEGDWHLAEAASAATLIGLALLAAAIVLSRRPEGRPSGLGRAALWPGLTGILAALGLLQFATEPARFAGGYLLWIAAPAVVAVVAVALALTSARTSRTALAALVGLAAVALAFAALVPADEFVAGLVGGAIVLAATVWAVHLGRADVVPFATPTGLAAFGLEVVYIYVATLGTVLDTSLVFVTGGALFILLAFVLYRVERWLARPPAEAAS